MTAERIVFVTGKLAEPALSEVVTRLAASTAIQPRIAVLPISVAALMHTDWVARKLQIEEPCDRVILPGWCDGDLQTLQRRFGIPVQRGPKDLHDLPEFLGGPKMPLPPTNPPDIEILAEINHAPRLSDTELFRLAEQYRDSGADVIDLGTVPGQTWQRAGEVTRRLRAEGFRVSIDSFDRKEVETAVEAGAEVVLSVNGSNIDWASRLPAELVVIPDDPRRLETLDASIERLAAEGARFRIDPILEPVGAGFAASLKRYFDVRRNYPDRPILMGVGNLTELTEVDSAGINVLLAAICQELRIESVLTTQVANWCRSAIAELDLARRIVQMSVQRGVPPKSLDDRLLMLRDRKVPEMTRAELEHLAARLRDPNFRIFVAGGEIHLMNRHGYWHGTDPFALFEQAAQDNPPLDASHAFYLGYELAKARTALTLGKRYVQDEALRWGLLTVPEHSRHASRQNGPGDETSVH